MIALTVRFSRVHVFYKPHKRRKFEERFQNVVESENRKTVDMLLENINVNKRETHKVQNIKTDKSDARTGGNSTPQIMNSENAEDGGAKYKENVQGENREVTNDQIVAFCVGAISAVLLSAALG